LQQQEKDTIMITSISNDYQTICLRSLQPDAVNIFDIDSISLLIGNNGSGKTRFLEQIINELRSSHVGVYHGACQIYMHGQPVSDHDTRVWGVIYYSPVPYRLHFRSDRNGRIIDASPKSTKELPLMKLNEWYHIAQELGITPKLVAKINIDLKPLLIDIINIGMKWLTDDWKEIFNVDDIKNYHITEDALNTDNNDYQSAGYTLKKSLQLKTEYADILLSNLIRRYSTNRILAVLVVLHRARLNKRLNSDKLNYILKHIFNLTITNHKRTTLSKEMRVFIEHMDSMYEFFIESDADIYLTRNISAEIDLHDIENAERVNNSIISDYFKIQFSQMSSGQMSMIAHLGLIMDAVEEQHKKGWREILILIDEGDAFLHLEWQRKYIYTLNKILGSAKRRLHLNVLQLIISTHSPLLATDIPKEFICRLHRSDEKISNEVINGFAAPIPQLIHDSFLANTIGEFATSKINETWIKISTKKEADANDLYIINNIDNRLLREEMERFLPQKGGYHDPINRE
jgi:predicted ATP-binding protein involved in virulence